MRVIHFPAAADNSRGANPYTRLVINSLKARGFAATGRPNAFHTNPWKALSWARNQEIVHWHWLDGHYGGRTALRFVARSFLFALTLSAIRLSGTRMVLTVHNLVPHEHRYRGLHFLTNRACGLLMHRLIVHNEAAVKVVAQEYGAKRKVSVVEHIDYGPTLREPRLSRVDAKRELGWDPARRHALFFGQIRPYKGVPAFAQSASLLASEVDLVIAGVIRDPNLRKHLIELAAAHENVRLRFEYIPDEELSKYLWASDVAVFPYAESLASGAAHLALAHGVPIVAPNTPAFQELIELKLAVECEDSNSQRALAEAVRAAVAMDYAEWSEQCDRYRARCSAEMVGSKLAAIYEQALGRLHHSAERSKSLGGGDLAP